MAASRHVVASVRPCLSFNRSTFEDSRKASKFMIDTGAGVIDADYRGVVFVLLFNLSDKDFQGVYQMLHYIQVSSNLGNLK